MDKNFLDYEGLTDYDSRIKNHITAEITTKHANAATVQDVAALEEPDESDIDDLAEAVATKVAQAFFNATEETVLLTVTTSVNNVTLQGKEINVFYNGSSTLGGQYILDANGMCSFKVPNGYVYKITFPDITGCVTPSNVLHTASILLRSVEVEYEAVPSEVDPTDPEYGELITVVTLSRVNNTFTKLNSVNVTLRIGNNTTVKTTDNNGEVHFSVPYGTQYSIIVSNIVDYYVSYASYTRNFTANLARRIVIYEYRLIESGVFIVTPNGDEYTVEGWRAALQEETVINSDAKFIKISSANLASNGGLFYIDIDMLSTHTGLSLLRYIDQNMNFTFNNIPNEGNSASSLGYYNGLYLSLLTIAEAVDRGMGIPALNAVKNLTRKLNEGTAEEIVLLGFIGAIGLWSTLWANVSIIDEILLLTRENDSYTTFSTMVTEKWTSSQSDTALYYWKSTYTQANNGANAKKYMNCTVVPFFAAPCC